MRLWKHVLLATSLAGAIFGGVQASQQPAASADGAAYALIDRAIANQHHNDAAAYGYERIQRQYSRAGSRVAEDLTYRIVPTGTGVLKLLVKQDGRPVAPALYQQELRNWEQVLSVAVNPNDPRERLSEEKMQKKEKERAELVNAVRDAYRFTWLGREAYQGRAVIKIGLAPNPAFHPRSRMAEMLGHARGTVWLDESAAQVVHVEAEIIRDIAVGGGLLGKIYRGGRFQMDQAEIAPGVWLPTRFQGDYEGRKLVFGIYVHETFEMSHYVFRGKPQQALAQVRGELAARRGFSADP